MNVHIDKEISEKIADKLLECGAVKLNMDQPFTWTSGWKSPIYCDNRLTLSYPEVRNDIKEALIKISEFFQPFDYVAGVATAGIAQGVLLADALELPFVYVRDKPKGHGMGNQIEGKIDKGKRVLIFEDLISTGGSVIKAVDACRKAGFVVQGVLAAFEYNFELANEALKMEDISYMTLSNYDTLIRKALTNDVVKDTDMASLEAWRQDPQNWNG